MTHPNGAAPAMAPRTVTLGERDVTLERVSALKAARALALIRAITKAAPDLQREWARFRADYEATNVIELDRAQASLRYPPQALAGDDGLPMREPEHLADGSPNPRAGALLMLPSPLSGMTEEAWQQAGHRLRLPKSPSPEEQTVAILDLALERCEDLVYRLLALFTIPNRRIAELWRQGGDTFQTELAREAEELLETAYADELMELAAVAGELVDEQFRRKARDITGRLGNLRRLFDQGQSSRPTTTTDVPTTDESTTGPSSSTPTSSTVSPPPTDAPPTPDSSNSHGTSPSPSSPASDETASSPSSTPPSSALEAPPAPTEHEPLTTSPPTEGP